MSKQITIVGGGLAGLSLGIALRIRKIPVRLLEAGSYPRHRVCGEFICGVDQSTLKKLGILRAFDQQVTNHDSQWFYHDRPVLKKRLPKAAIGISRHHLDHWLAEKFVSLGGDLETNTRANPSERPEESTVWSCGRQRASDGEWIGLKCHVTGFTESMDTDLQMHFGRDCYVGISKVENATANVCGLFKLNRELKAKDRSALLLAYLRASQLGQLACQLESAEMQPDSVLGVTAFKLGHQPLSEDKLQIGDAYSMIPPFTGNGMTMAFQSAEIALQPLLDYAGGKENWTQTIQNVNQLHRKRFKRRVNWAMKLHPFLLNPFGQKTLVTMARARLIPFGLFFEKTR
ncbi:MAG: flavin-dependent dehydrogenase [Verrucomicrobiales bacterium]|jgi:flavin-dependent dehydrogenase